MSRITKRSIKVAPEDADSSPPLKRRKTNSKHTRAPVSPTKVTTTTRKTTRTKTNTKKRIKQSKKAKKSKKNRDKKIKREKKPKRSKHRNNKDKYPSSTKPKKIFAKNGDLHKDPHKTKILKQWCQEDDNNAGSDKIDFYKKYNTKIEQPADLKRQIIESKEIVKIYDINIPNDDELLVNVNLEKIESLSGVPNGDSNVLEDWQSVVEKIEKEKAFDLGRLIDFMCGDSKVHNLKIAYEYSCDDDTNSGNTNSNVSHNGGGGRARETGTEMKRQSVYMETDIYAPDTFKQESQPSRVMYYIY